MDVDNLKPPRVALAGMEIASPGWLFQCNCTMFTGMPLLKGGFGHQSVLSQLDNKYQWRWHPVYLTLCELGEIICTCLVTSIEIWRHDSLSTYWDKRPWTHQNVSVKSISLGITATSLKTGNRCVAWTMESTYTYSVLPTLSPFFAGKLSSWVKRVSSCLLPAYVLESTERGLKVDGGV